MNTPGAVAFMVLAMLTFWGCPVVLGCLIGRRLRSAGLAFLIGAALGVGSGAVLVAVVAAVAGYLPYGVPKVDGGLGCLCFPPGLLAGYMSAASVPPQGRAFPPLAPD